MRAAARPSSPISPSRGRAVRTGFVVRTAGAVGLLALVPAVLIVAEIVRWSTTPGYGSDLRIAYLSAAEAVIHGTTPYPSVDDPVLATGTAYVYPPILAFAVSPFLLVPYSWIVPVAVVIGALLVLLLLFISGVRDWRCYGAAMLWPPVTNALVTLNVSLVVALLLVLTWRMRNRPLSSGFLMGTMVGFKLFVWPLLTWPTAMHRWRAAVAGIVSLVLLVIGPWAVLGFSGLREYPGLLRRLAALEGHDSYSIPASLGVLGIDPTTGRSVALMIGFALVALAVVFGRRGDDRRSFVAAVLAALAASPIVWQHYYLALLAVLAISRPRLSVIWLLPIVMWVAPMSGNGSPLQTLVVTCSALVVGAVCLTEKPLRVDQSKEVF